MYINFDDYPFEMILTYSFKEDMVNQEEYISDVRALTLNPDKPLLGLKGNKGLYATPEWWESIDNRNIPSITFCGEIIRTYVAGMDNSNTDNSFSFLSQENRILDESIYYIDKKHQQLFKKRHFVVIVYAFDEMKVSTPENPDFSNIVLEMAVSKYPIP
ncbi:hypothetical protein [Moraxella sp. ZY210820]|uniref:hypothetical protein n=1 Tax=unclassified Moraxella TaxID=2685852 RepID=UPI002730D3B3|nr:hypothetical protein [Moraxella sp. ZY210820]WLF84052.1 hypothetical protein LU301_00630 [Moraxella sp. ZY210820]